MPVEVQCPGCQQRFRAQDHLAGKTVQCRCGTQLQIPALAPAADPLADLPLEDPLAVATAPLATRPPGKPRSRPGAGGGRPAQAKAKTKKRSGAGSTRSDIKWALIATGVVFLLVVILGGIGIWYIGTHPVAGATKEQRATKLGSGIGTFAGILLAIPWLTVAVRHRKRLDAS